MRLLLDESVPRRLRRSLSEHDVKTVAEAGWSGEKNGKLLALAAADYDALITVDKNLQYQQNMATLPVAVVLLDAVSNELPVLLALVPNLNAALRTLQPRTFVVVRAEI